MKRDKIMEEYFWSIEKLVSAYLTLEDLSPDNELLRYIEVFPGRNGNRSSFKFRPGFHERYGKIKSAWDYDAIISQHRKYENEIRAEILIKEAVTVIN